MARPCIHSPRQQPNPTVPAPKDSQLPGGTWGRRGSWQLLSHKLSQELGQKQGKQELWGRGSWCITLMGRGTEQKGFSSRGNGIEPSPHHLGWIRAACHQPGLEAGEGHRGPAVTPWDMAGGTPRSPHGSHGLSGLSQRSGSWYRHPHGDQGCLLPTRCKSCGHQLRLDMRRDQRDPVNSDKGLKCPCP